MKIQARHFETQEAIEVNIEGELIHSILPFVCSALERDRLPYISPGFFDIQVNGYNGIWFSSPELTVEDVVATIRSLASQGIARCFPTLITASFEVLRHGFETLEKACAQDETVARCVAGYHLEGPYISPEDGPRGAHPIQHVRPANWEEFQKLQASAGGRIRLVTLAAECDNAVPFIRKCCSDGVVVALGHTGASSEQIMAAADAGARLCTHFGNGAHGTLPRHPNYLWAQLADDRLWASVIADGWHVPDAVLQCVAKCKTLNRTILTCDVSGFAGCKPGVYAEGDVGVEVLEDGRLVVAGQRQYLAGSGVTTGHCIAKMRRACGIPLLSAVQMATLNPSVLVNEPLVELKEGCQATLTVFHLHRRAGTAVEQFVPVRTFVRGEIVGCGT